MSRCWGCCQENCQDCACQCHDADKANSTARWHAKLAKHVSNVVSIERMAACEAEVRKLQGQLVELRELCLSRLCLPANQDFTDEEPTQPDARLVTEPKTTDYCLECGHSPDSGVHLFHHNYEPPKEKAPPVSRQGHLPDCIGGYSCEASC